MLKKADLKAMGRTRWAADSYEEEPTKCVWVNPGDLAPAFCC
jgi:hypothetical protein